MTLLPRQFLIMTHPNTHNAKRKAMHCLLSLTEYLRKLCNLLTCRPQYHAFHSTQPTTKCCYTDPTHFRCSIAFQSEIICPPSFSLPHLFPDRKQRKHWCGVSKNQISWVIPLLDLGNSCELLNKFKCYEVHTWYELILCFSKDCQWCIFCHLHSFCLPLWMIKKSM
jgi:hypothetical protein